MKRVVNISWGKSEYSDEKWFYIRIWNLFFELSNKWKGFSKITYPEKRRGYLYLGFLVIFISDFWKYDKLSDAIERKL